MVAYDWIGATYRSTRRADPRIASQVHAALATMGTVVNVGAGTGSYEPAQTVAAVEPGMVTTIEPGIYFIDMLLAELRKKPVAKDVNWDKVDAFRKYGGIRIEDDVVCTNGEPENLTREAFAAAV